MGDREIYNMTMQGYLAAIAQADANIQAARITGNDVAASEALMEKASMQVQMEKAHALSVQHAQSMQTTAQRNKFGLSPEEVDIAHRSFSGESLGHRDQGMTLEQKEESFARNKAKLHRMRANGEYRQTTEQTG